MNQHQTTMNGQFDESEAKERLTVHQRDELESALTACGYRYTHTAWLLAIFIHHVATGDGILRRSPKRLAADKRFKPKERSIRMARQSLADAGIIDLIEVKNHDGGDDLKAMRINRVNVRILASGERLPKKENKSDNPSADADLQTVMQSANRGANQSANRGANHAPLLKTINHIPPQPPTNFKLDQSAVEAVEIFVDAGLSKRESNRIVMEHGIDPQLASNVVATFRHNKHLRSEAAMAYFFDHGEWPAKDVTMITAEESHARIVRAAHKRLTEMADRDERLSNSSHDARRHVVESIMQNEFGEDWKSLMELDR